MLGLAIVIILIMVGILFVVKFTLREQTSQARTTFTSAEIASNLANTVLETSDVDCHGLSVKTLLEDCAKPPSDIDCDNNNVPDSCQYALDIIDELLKDTLVAWERPFVFNVTQFPGAQRYLFSGGAPSNTGLFQSTPGVWVWPPRATGPTTLPDGDYASRESKIFIVPLNPGTLFIRVDLYS